GCAGRQGLAPLSSTQDPPRPLARSMTDPALGLQVLYGVDPADPATARTAGRPAPDLLGALDRNALRGARIGVLLPSFGTAPEDAEGAEVVQGAPARVAAAAAVLGEVPCPELGGLLAGP